MNTTAPHPPSHGSGTGPRRLVRLTDQARWGGVAAGLGWYFGLDPNLFRVGFIVLGLSTGGLAVLAYILLMLVLPKETTATSGLSAPGRSTPRTQAIAALAIIAGVIVIGQLDVFRFDVLLGAALIGVGVLLFSDGGRELTAPPWLRGERPVPDAASPAAAAPTPPTPPPPHPGQQPTAPPPGHQASAYAAPYAARHQHGRGHERVSHSGRRGRRQPRPRSLLTPLTIGIWLLVLGAAAFLAGLGLFEMTATLGAGITLAVLGTGMLIGTRFGRARGLIPLGLLTLVFLGGVTGVQVAGFETDFGAGVGQRTHQPTTVEQVDTEYRLFAGELLLDLSELDLEGHAVEIATNVSLGEVTIIVPDDVRVLVDAQVQAGELEVFGERKNGTDLSFDSEAPGTEGNGLIRLDADLTFGDLTIQQEESR